MWIYVSLSQAKAQLSTLVEQAAKGEVFVITKRGKPSAILTALAHKNPTTVNRAESSSIAEKSSE